jgi:glycosyltransferase involved in cell wall biosynthesis
MKILRIIARLNVGGPARHVVWLTKGLQDEEFQSVLAAGTVPDGEEDMSYLAAESQIEPVYIKEMSRELSLRDAVSLLKVYRSLRQHRPDIVHTHTAKAGTVGRAAAFLYRWLSWGTILGRPRRIRVVHTFHGHVFHSYYGRFKTRFFLSIEKLLARLATDVIIVISPQQLEEINEKFGVGRREQFEVIPLGIDLNGFSGSEEDRISFRNAHGAGEDEILVGFVGRLTEIKNVSLFLKSAALYANSASDNLPKIRFFIVGDGHMREQLVREREELGLGDTVVFLGNRNDTERIYPGFDIVALTSFNEGTPLSLIEAMASGRPVISTAVGGVNDLLGVVEEKTSGFRVCSRGISVDSNDAEGFFKGLIYLIKNEKLRKNLGERGCSFVRSTYGKERLVNDIKDLYRKLHPNGRGPK